MATKKQNKRHVVRKTRRILNRTEETFTSLGNMNKYHYRGGIRRSDFRPYNTDQ